jgi:hypothetical protein
MAQAANIVVNDRATTPLAHTYAPKEKIDTGFLFREAALVPAGDRLLSIRKREGDKGKTYVRVLFTNPVMVTEIINGVSVPSVSRVSVVDCTFRFEANSTEQERADTVGMFANSLAASQTVVNSTIVKLEGIW